jgi:aminoglycoside phosphotransferase (APT) family kinase protein
VGTIEFIRRHSEIPVPKIYAFDSSSENDLGYEWILMERLPGVTYGSVSQHVSLKSRLAVARTIADWMHKLSTLRFGWIGSLHVKKGSSEFYMGRPGVKRG